MYDLGFSLSYPGWLPSALQAIEILWVGVPPFRLVSPLSSRHAVSSHLILLALLHVSNIWLGVSLWTTLQSVDECLVMRITLSFTHFGLALVGVSCAALVATLRVLGPPTYDRRDKSDQKRAVIVDFLRTMDFGEGEGAEKIRQGGGTLGMCHCPGK
jgi:hypothetical protein